MSNSEYKPIPATRKETLLFKMIFELKKDLQEDEVICPHCKGTGLEIRDNVYGIVGDTTHIGFHLPYKHQSISFCRHCYNGVQTKCPACGSLRGKMDRECSCGCSERKRQEKWETEKKERWNSANKIPLTEAWVKCSCLYVENIDHYVFNKDELDDLIEEYELDKSSLIIYTTTKISIEIDADDVASNACENLFEDAVYCCDIAALQKVLDDWCKQQTGTTTYIPDFSTGVIVFENTLYKESRNE